MHCGAVVRWAPRSLRLMGALFSLVQQQLALVVGDLCEHSCICISSIYHGADTQRTCFAGDSAWRRPVGLSCLDPVVRDTDWERREGGLSDGPMLSVEVIECTLHAMGRPR
jgi:hypothetical protein